MAQSSVKAPAASKASPARKTASARSAGSARKASPASKAPVAVGVIGLGIMGSAMSANLVKAGFQVFGYDPVAKSRARLAKAGGVACDSAEAVARQARFLVLSLPSEAALDDVCAALAKARRKGQVVAETSTLPEAAKARAHAALARHGITLLDCPLSGTGAQAVTRDLAVYASGDAAAIKAFGPVFEGFARVRYDVGGFGNGIRMKLVANLLVAIHNISAAEALALGARAGLDPAMVVRVVADGAGGSRMLQVRGPAMVARTWGEATMKVSTWQKDMRLISDQLASTDTAAPLFSTCIPIYNAAMALGHAGDDTAAVYSVLEHMMGGAPKPAPRRARPKAA